MNSAIYEFAWLRNRNQLRYRQQCNDLRDSCDIPTLLKVFLFYHQYATTILKRNPSDRFEEELLLIQKATEKMEFFHDLNLKRRNVENKLHIQCCQKMTLKTFAQGEILFKQDDKGDEAYIILNGRVNIYAALQQNVLYELAQRSRKKYEQLNQQQRKLHPINIVNQARKERLRSKMALPLHMLKKFKKLSSKQEVDSELVYKTIHIIEEVKYEEEKDKQVLEQQQELGLEMTSGIPPFRLNNLDFFFQEGVFKHKFIVEMAEGQMFGELALLWNQPRSATVVAKTNVDVAVLSGNDYKALLKESELNKIELRIKFFQDHFFKQSPRIITLRYCYNFIKNKYKRGNHVYKIDDKITHIYLIKKGIVEVTTQQVIDSHFNDQQQLSLAKSQSQLLMAIKQTEMIPTQSTVFQRILYTLTGGDIVGDIEILLKHPQRLSTIRVQSDQATIYSLNISHFYRILSDQPGLGRILRNAAQIKYQQYYEIKDKNDKFYLKQYEQIKLNQQLFVLSQNNQLQNSSKSLIINIQNQDSKFKIITPKISDEDLHDLQHNSLKALLLKIKKKVNQKSAKKLLRQKKTSEELFRNEIRTMENSKEKINKFNRQLIDCVPSEIKQKLLKSKQTNDELRKELGSVSMNQKTFLDFKLMKSEYIHKQLRTCKSTDRSVRVHSTTNHQQKSFFQGFLSSKRIDTSHVKTDKSQAPSERVNYESFQNKPIIIQSKHNQFRKKPQSRLLYSRYSNQSIQQQSETKVSSNL